MRKILCVEDGEDTLLILKSALNHYQLTFARTLSQARRYLDTDRFDVLIVDINLPDGNGLEFVASFIEQLRNTPVFVLTGKTDFASKASAFSLGADDFIQKPFDPRELRLRVDARVKKSSDEHSLNSFLVGPLTVNTSEQRLYMQGGGPLPVDLTALEFRIFLLLARTPNRIFSRNEILGRVWGESISVSERAVDVHVSNLRRKIAGSGVSVEAVIGTGYRVVIEDRPQTLISP